MRCVTQMAGGDKMVLVHRQPRRDPEKETLPGQGAWGGEGARVTVRARWGMQVPRAVLVKSVVQRASAVQWLWGPLGRCDKEGVCRCGACSTGNCVTGGWKGGCSGEWMELML